MKQFKGKKSILLWCTGVLLISFIACNKWEVEPGFNGTWESDATELTVRIEPTPHNYEFIKGYAVLTLTIHEDKTVDGTLGEAAFSNVDLMKRTGVSLFKETSYTFLCDSIGKIFENDPLEKKEIEFNLNMGDAGMLEAGLWYTEDGADFPMGTIMLSKSSQE